MAVAARHPEPEESAFAAGRPEGLEITPAMVQGVVGIVLGHRATASAAGNAAPRFISVRLTEMAFPQPSPTQPPTKSMTPRTLLRMQSGIGDGQRSAARLAEQ